MEMTIVKMHKKALSRQIHEAVMISKSAADILLNNKSEWSKDKIPRVKVNTRGDEKKREEKEKAVEEQVRRKEEEMRGQMQPPMSPVQSKQMDQHKLQQHKNSMHVGGAKRKRDDEEPQGGYEQKRARMCGGGEGG